MIRLRSFVSAVAAGAALGCADTNAPLPEPQEVLLVVNSTANTLSIVPVDAPNSSVQVPLGGTTPTPVGVSARGGFALVPLGLDNAVAVVDLRAGQRDPHRSAARQLGCHRVGHRGRLDRLRRQSRTSTRCPG